MALTLTQVDNGIVNPVGVYKQRLWSIAFDSSYPTGGLSLTAAMLGLTTVTSVEADAKSGYTFEYDYTNSKLLAYRPDNPNVAQAAQVEVTNATNLSTLTGVRVVATGY